MKKITGILLILLVVLIACDNKSSLKSSPPAQDSSNSKKDLLKQVILLDSLEIYDNLAEAPFPFADTTLKNVLGNLPNKVLIDKSIEPTPSDTSYRDTVWKIRFDKSLIVYKRNEFISGIYYARIMNSEIKLKKNIKIGDSFQSISEKIKELKGIDNTPDKLYIYYGEAINMLLLEFLDNNLTKIEYWPYSG